VELDGFIVIRCIVWIIRDVIRSCLVRGASHGGYRGIQTIYPSAARPARFTNVEDSINESTKALIALAATDLPVCAFRFGWATVMRYMSIIMVMAPGRLCLSASRGFRPEPSPVVDVDVDVESPVGVELGGSGVHGVA
jgi:hypothetical protein